MQDLIIEIKREVGPLVPSQKELRRFGLVVGGIFALLSAYFYYQAPSQWEVVIGSAGVILILGGIILPRALKWPYKFWLGLSLILGFIVSHVVLTILFYLVITPIAIVKRLVTKKSKVEPTTYWQPHADTDWSKTMEEMS